MSPTAVNEFRIKGDYFQVRIVNPHSFDDCWIDTNIRATPYKHSDLVPISNLFQTIKNWFKSL